MKRLALRLPLAALMLAVAGWVGGCASTNETAERDTLTSNVGIYPPAPSGIEKPRVGVPPFKVQGEGAFGGEAGMNDLAADQMTTLLDQSERFKVVERTQLQKLLDEQNLEGIVKPGELAQAGQVRGVDYLLIGRVTNLRVKSETKERGFGLGQVGGLINLGGADYKKKDIAIHTEAGVDIRLVDPTTGELMVSNFSEYKKTDSASAIGLDILGASADADANIEIGEDDKGKILRLALDDALRKSLPKIDKFLTSRSKQGTSAAGATSNNAGASNSLVPAQATEAQAQPAGEKKFCGHCGAQVAATSKFCASCGQKVE